MRLIGCLSLGIVSVFTMVQAGNVTLLSKLKQDILANEKKTNELNSDNLEKSWINSVVGSFSYSNSDSSGERRESNTLSVSINQPIFKSGGIYYAIKYADANRGFLRISTKLNEQTEIKTVLSSLYSLKKLDLQIQKQKYMIDNANIDIIRRKEQYISGFLDSSYLNQAILSQSTLQRSLLDMKSSRLELLRTLKSYSDADIDTVSLPHFTLINKTEFLNKSLLLRQKNSEIIKNNYLKKMTLSSYLPTVTFSAGYYDTRDFGTRKYTSFGLSVSMPLVDINRGRSIEIKRLEYLKSKLELQDTKRAESETFDLAVKKIKLLEKKIALAKVDLKLYDSLLLSTRDSYKAGEKTIYDVDTLKNSKNTMALDIKIFKTDIELSLLDLYAKMNGKI
ncbi:MAG: TolC family protein [Sulfurospirillum sp.]